MARKKAGERKVAVGDIRDVSGEVTIAGGDIYKGFTADQVSVLITKITTTFQPKTFDGRCPYKGLDVFEEEDAELFFGRERLVDDLVSRVKDSRIVFVTGPSGSGKSSLVRAGLIHALKQGAVKDLHSERWLYATMKPGRDPLGELARMTAGLAGSTNVEDEVRAKALADTTIFARWCEIALKDGRDKRAVLFIDQFEEVFTQISKDAERVAFLNLLTHAATVESGRVIILFSMRSDFVSNCATYPQLNALLNQQFVQIGAMQSDELVSAIAQPALRVGLRIDPDLIAQIINDMQGEPGALPLMQFALKDLFDSQQAEGGVIALTLSDYLQRGGIHKALERHADASFAKLDKHEQELARSIFSGLIEIGRGTQDTRRTALFDEIVPANTNVEDTEIVVRKLADARLITTDEQAGKDTVTISHEKLIDAWPWLKRLVNENRDAITLQNEIASDAREWQDHERDGSYLYRGARLVNAREQLQARKLILSGTAQEFVHAGRTRQQRSQMSLIAGIATVIVLLFAAVLVFREQSITNSNTASTAQAANTQVVSQKATAQAIAITAQANANEAQKQTRLARNGEIAANAVALRDSNFQLSLLLSIKAYMNLVTVQSEGVLLDNVQAHPQLRSILNGHTNGVLSVAFSPDGKTLASGSWDNTIILWDVPTSMPIGQPLTSHNGSVNCVTFSPDGKTLASGSNDNTIILWNVATHLPVGHPLRGDIGPVSSVAFSPDGKTLVSDGSNGPILLWDMTSNKPIGQPLTGPIGWVDCIAFSSDGKMLASVSSDKTIILWNVETGKPIGHPFRGDISPLRSVAFSPDGKTLASGSDDGTIILWDVATSKPIGQPLKGHTDVVASVAFSPDGEILASGSYDNTIILWDVATRKPIGQPLTWPLGWVVSIAFSPDGKMLASGNGDGPILLWDMTNSKPISQALKGHTDRVTSVAFSSDGEILASGSNDNTIILWDLATGKPIGQPLTNNDSVYSVTFSPDGKTLASGNVDNSIILWNVVTGKPIGQPLKGHTSVVNSVAFNPDGKILASGSTDGTIILWDVATRNPIGLPLSGHSGVVNSVAFSPDGKTLASGSGDSIDSTIFLWDVATGEQIGKPLKGHESYVLSVTFSPDGKMLASGSLDNTIILWDVATGKTIGLPFTGHTEPVESVTFSPDGKLLASGSWDNTIILWDVATHLPIGQSLRGHTDWVNSIAFSPTGKTLASGSADGTIRLWDVDPQSWIQKSCYRAGRNFTRAEWIQYFPNEPYHATCPQWPLEPEATPSP